MYETLTEFISMAFGTVAFISVPCVLTYMLFKIPGFNKAFEKFFKLDVED